MIINHGFLAFGLALVPDMLWSSHVFTFCRQVLVESIKLFFHDCGQLNHWRKWWPVYGIASLGVLAFFTTESNQFESIISIWMADACDLGSLTSDQQLNITCVTARNY